MNALASVVTDESGPYRPSDDEPFMNERQQAYFKKKLLDWKEDVLPEDKCHCCQFPARLRPHVVWFGEMPLGMDDIYSALAMADVFIAIGTSGHVYPAAGFVHEARLHGAHTVELNLEPSQVGSEFEEKHYGLASTVVPEFVDKLLKGL